MNERLRFSIVRNHSIVRAALVTVAVLLIPLWGEFHVDGWNWGWRGFVNAAIFVFTAAMTYQLVAKTVLCTAYRFAVGLAVVTAAVLLWMNFVSMADANPAHALYFGVPIVAIVGSAIARLRPSGMAVALFVTAIAQLLVPFVVLVLRETQVAPGAAVPLFGRNAVFIALFAISALLFRRAGLMRATRSAR